MRFRLSASTTLLLSLATGLMPGAVRQLHAATSAAAQTPSADAALQQRVVQARTALLAGTDRPNDLIAEVKSILAINPEHAEAHVLLALAYRAIGNTTMLAEAIAEFRQALALDPSLAAARYYLAGAYLDLGRAERARTELEAALVQVPGQPQFTTLLADAERRAGNPERGLQLAQQILATNPALAEARYYAAMCLLDLKRRTEAVAQFEQLANSGVRTTEVTGTLGALYLEDGRLDEAVAMLTMATQTAPTRPDLRVLLARAYRLRGALPDAEQQLAQALPPGAAIEASTFYENAAADIRFETGLIRLQQNRMDDAIAELTQAAELRPAHGETRRALAECYLRAGRTDLATAQASLARAAGTTLPDSLSALLPPLPTTTPRGQE